MGKAIKNIFKLDTLTLTECTDGFYLYDKVLGYNIVMRAKTEQEACIEALTKYQKKLSDSKESYDILNGKVQNFISEFVVEDEHYNF